MKRLDYKILLTGAAVLCLLAAAASLCLGELFLSPGKILGFLMGQEQGTPESNIFRFARLPRTLGCLLAGAALSTSGAVLQKVLANRLASPSIIGVNAGAGLGLSLCCAMGALSGWAFSLSAFLGALAAICMIVLLSRSTRASKTTVILSGVAMNSILNACNEAISILDPNIAVMNLEFRIGGFSSVSYIRLIPAGVLILSALLVLTTLYNELDVLALGDDTAGSLGLPVKRYRMLFLILCALLAGAAVSFAGLLGFVGLIVPQFVRRLSGGESKKLLPLTALVGAGFVTACDLAARLIFRPFELPVGIIMAFLGGPAFLLLLLRYKGGRENG